MNAVKPWTRDERLEILEACKGGETSFDIGNLRWEATVRDLEQHLSDLAAKEPLVTLFKDTANQCIHLARSALDKSPTPEVKKLMGRISGNLGRIVSRLDYNS